MDDYISKLVMAAFPLGAGKNTNAIDCGCGRGKNALGLFYNGFNVLAIDRNADTIHSLNSVIAHLGVNLPTQVAAIQHFHSDMKYNLVLFNNVLHFIPEQERAKAIANVVNLVALNGYLIFSDLEDSGAIPDEYISQLSQGFRLWYDRVEIVNDPPHLDMPMYHTHKVRTLLLYKV